MPWTPPHPHSPQHDTNGVAVSAVDWLGNRFHIGDTVMYCVAAGRGQMMALGIVRRINTERKTYNNGRRAEPGEIPTRVLDWHNPPIAWIDTTVDYDEVTVLVHTLCTSGRWNNKQRDRPTWVNPMNITALGQPFLTAVTEHTVNPASDE